MANSLIACGGTGAHVALALMRLHTLGYALGFFRSSNDRRLDFPTLYLVDQDAGDGEQDATAWQMVRRLAEAHPGRHDRRETISREEGISVRVVTPLPIGGDRDWFAAPNDTLRKRFGESPYLDLLTDREQRDIEFSRGMMGSPAVGALLFHLKKYDVMPSGVNLDGDFQALRKERGRIAVVGSGVGGTGAAVAPTLARQLAAADGNHVMAVMLLDWFRFRTDDADDALREKADLRNDAMRRNAHSALAYCGRALADAAAAVPVGVPERALVERRYTSDTQQPTCESFVHGVAALCSLRHFLAGEPYSRGLYQMGAADPATLGGGNAIPGGTLQDLANQAATLADALNVFATVLSSSHSGRFGVVPALHAAVRRLAAADPGQTAQALRALAARYREHLDWLRKVGVEPRPVRALTVEARSRERLIDHKISDHRNLSAEAAAHALFHWVADWIREYRGTRPDGLVMRPTPANGGYWPPLSPGEGISTAADAAGELTRIRDQNIDATLKGFVQTAQISENGWPYPIAVADHFRHAIRNEDPKATRQLEMLLAGLVSGTLMLQEVPPPGTPSAPVSLDALVEEFREEEFPDLGRYEVVWPDKNYEVLGFNAPHTLLCAKPPAEPHAARIWALLWEKLTGSSRPENWATEVRTVWTHVDRAVRQIRAWLGHLKKAHPGVPPPWTRIFELQSESTPIAHGHDSREFSVYWSSGEPVRIALPTAESGGYRPHPGTTFLPENELLAEIPELRRLEDASGRMLFELVDFEAPNRERPVRALWREHLEHLQQRGLIAGFGGGGKDAEETVFIWLRDRSRSAKLSKTRVLDRERIMVKRCSPMRQDPVPGSTRKPRETCYPDLPLRSEYIGLVQTDGGKPLLDALKAGDTSSSAPPALRPVVDDRTRGQSATWTLQLAGHGDPLPIVLPVAPDEDHHQAHWMVWPRFRSTHHPTGSLGDAPEGAFWRAYYVYEHCTDARLHLETLWLEPDSNRVQRCEAPERSGSHPVRFEVGDRRRHTGGPPLAFSARHAATGEEVGLYLIRLQRLSANDSDVRVGIDFGTSHTVAAVRTAEGRSSVELAPELDPASAGALTLHVSENWSHVTASFDDRGLSALSVWLPNYVGTASSTSAGLLPSELLTIRPLHHLNAGDIGRWQPGRDCVIPGMNMQRPDLADHILADFKWDVLSGAFQGREAALREIYLGMAVELILADIVVRRGALPGRPVDFTFTYPLRSREGELESFQETLNRVMEGGSHGLGCELRLIDGVGRYSESRAAKGGTGSFGEVSLVGDLGGGTLDLFISANALPGVEFEEAAESAQIGGNVLLRSLAGDPARFLPEQEGWKTDDTEKLQTQLRAWMRSKGSRALFGGGGVRHEGLGLRGFDRSSQADRACQLINRYFRLIGEYMARSLVAFIARHWYPKAPAAHRDRLQVLVQLRGNGWRLWPDATSYRQVEAEIGGWIEERARVLWNDANLWSDATSAPEPPRGPWSNRDTGNANPKTAPILAAVGETESPEELARIYSHTLVELDLLHFDRSDLGPVPWFSRIPFRTGGKATKVEFNAIEPPLLLSHPDAGAAGTTIGKLDEQLMKKINDKIQEERSFPNEVDFRAPVAPIVWEAAFESKQFLGDD